MTCLLKAFLSLRVKWSNLRNKKNITECPVEEKISKPLFIVNIARQMYTKFTYQYDGPTELFDSMRFPAQCYTDYKNGLLKDDCDGFHAALYHVAESNSYDSYLLTYIPTKLSKSHTVLLIKHNNYFYVDDYTTIYKCESIEKVIERLENKHNIKILCYNFVKFDKDKYIVVNL